METLFTPQVVGVMMGQLGFSAVFLWLWLRFEKKNEEREQRLLEQMKTKDLRLQEKSDKLLSAYNDNIRVQAGVREALRENTKAIERNINITDEMYKLLLSRRKNGSD